jgi:hypothetical protein
VEWNASQGSTCGRVEMKLPSKMMIKGHEAKAHQGIIHKNRFREE